jgi:hypothetical protein
VLVAARQGAEALRTQGVEAHRQPPEPGALQRRRLLGQQDPVGRQRQVAEPRLPRQESDEHIEVAPQERLAARQADLLDAEREEHVDEPRQLLEREDVGARQPHVLLLRHAVGAAQVAAVRDREPQVAERPAEAIEGRHRTHDDATDRSLRALRPGRSLIEGGQLLDARERAVFTEQPEHRRPHEVCVAVERRVPACGPVEIRVGREGVVPALQEVAPPSASGSLARRSSGREETLSHNAWKLSRLFA